MYNYIYIYTPSRSLKRQLHSCLGQAFPQSRLQEVLQRMEAALTKKNEKQLVDRPGRVRFGGVLHGATAEVMDVMGSLKESMVIFEMFDHRDGRVGGCWWWLITP